MNETDAATRLGIPVEELRAYEAGIKPITLGVVRKMAEIYELPVATLAMPTPPSPSQLPKDFRTIDGRQERVSPETAFAIRQARRLQALMQDLLTEEDDLAIRYEVPGASSQDTPESLAARERTRLGVSIKEQLDWTSEAQAFRNWRDRVESLGIFVYVLDMPYSDCRGFSLKETGNPVIVISKEEPTDGAKVFTLLHEYCHILRDQPGLSNLNDKNRVEHFCNEFAANFLMPKDALMSVLKLPDKPDEREWDLNSLKLAAKKLKVSQQALALRLENARYAASGLFDLLKEDQEKQSKRKTRRSQGPVPQDIKRLNEVGARYARNVLICYDRGGLDDVEASRMLNLAPRHFENLRSRLAGRLPSYGAARPRA